MMKDVAGIFTARKFPVRFVYGPERVNRELRHTVIIVERDRDQTDQVRATQGTQRNAPKVRVRDLAVKATIFARSSVSSAMIQEHERFCEQLVDALIVALEEWGTETKAGDIPITEGRYAKAEDHNDVETWPGVAYVLRFRVPRSVMAKTYAGEAKPTQALGGFSNRTDVSRTGGSEDADPETGCGG